MGVSSVDKKSFAISFIPSHHAKNVDFSSKLARKSHCFQTLLIINWTKLSGLSNGQLFLWIKLNEIKSQIWTFFEYSKIIILKQKNDDKK